MQTETRRSQPFQLPFLHNTTYGARLWGRKTREGWVELCIFPRNHVHTGYVLWRARNYEVIRRIDVSADSEKHAFKMLRIGVRILSMFLNGDELAARKLLAHYDAEILVTLRSNAEVKERRDAR